MSSLPLSVGQALSAMAILIALPSFLSPLVRFRLAVNRIRSAYIFIFLGVGFLLTVASYIVPENAAFQDININVLMQLAASIFLFLPIFTIGSSYFFAPKFQIHNSRRYVSALASLLSSQGSKIDERIIVDMLKNISIAAEAIESVDWRKANDNPFYAFSLRKQIVFAGDASIFVELFGDEEVIYALAERTPWALVTVLDELYKDDNRSRWRRDHSLQALTASIVASFLFAEKSMLDREASFDGFGRYKLVTPSLFGNIEVLRTARPFNLLSFSRSQAGSLQVCRRIRHALESSLDTMIESGSAWGVEYFDLKHLFDLLLIEAMRSENKGWEHKYEVTRCLKYVLDVTEDYFLDIHTIEKEGFFLREGQKLYEQNHNVVKFCAEIYYDAISALSSGMQDRPSGENGYESYSILDAAFSFHTDRPSGMTPFQQQLAIRLLSKVEENLNGFYPPVLRSLMTFFGLYSSNHAYITCSAYGILFTSFAALLKDFDILSIDFPEKIGDYLTDNYTYNEDDMCFVSNTGIRRKSERRCYLSSLPTSMPDLFDRTNFRLG